MRMLTAFLARVNPDSTIANPACIKNTRNAATSTHSVSPIYLASSTFVSVPSSSINPFRAKAFRLSKQVSAKTVMITFLFIRKFLLCVNSSLKLSYCERQRWHLDIHGPHLPKPLEDSGCSPRTARHPPSVRDNSDRFLFFTTCGRMSFYR